MTASILFEIGDQEYEVYAASFRAGYAPRGWDPGDSDELEIDNIVRVHFNPGYSDYTTLDAFILAYAAANRQAIRDVEDMIQGRLCEAAAEDLADRRDEARESYREW